MLNQCNFIGRLADEPKVRAVNGDGVCNFTIGCNETWKDKDGNKRERCEWVRCEAWRRLGEICAEYLHKGSLVFVSGKLKTRQYEDKDGNKRYVTEINLTEMKMLSRAGDTKPDEQGRAGGPDDYGGDLGEDVPF